MVDWDQLEKEVQMTDLKKSLSKYKDLTVDGTYLEDEYQIEHRTGMMA